MDSTIQSISGNAQAYDSKNLLYYDSVTTLKGVYYYCFDMLQKKLVHMSPVPFSLDNAEFDASENRLIGLVDDVFAYLDLESGKFVRIPSLNFSRIGFRQLGASAISSDSRYYFVFYENHQAESFFVRVDLKTLSYRVNQVYDLIGTMIYIP
ncbi:hypothetical protein FDP41_003356 [Naegleria fowleri]|uniref:Uncharacterized protein n=1 Tax=Naegleria fowleri TaxID=5763 RepID=A0A6A5BT19_NAEFO|nr:uncharacterized protein FDP41_003356 [Naegleria fowleri]KAF0977364.1 hypothetical protein FDP41_003356 [Naegleria fowleri]CAG4713595.1 unnamed protein product [Naegleria fowleri]